MKEQNFTSEHMRALLREFINGLQNQQTRYFDPCREKKSPDAIIVLSAPPLLDAGVWTEDTAENRSRILYAAELWQALQPGNVRIPFVLNGETQQLYMMAMIAQEAGIPLTEMLLLNCGNRGAANTMTQFQIMAAHPTGSLWKEVYVVTSLYHAPRVRRTAATHMPNCTCYVAPVPIADCPFDLGLVATEIQRIVDYTNNGTLSPA